MVDGGRDGIIFGGALQVLHGARFMPQHTEEKELKPTV
jgi:hypothetical protein